MSDMTGPPSPTERIPLLDIEETRRRADEHGIPRDIAELSVFRIALHQPGVAVALYGLLKNLLWRGTLDARLRELAIMRIGWVTGSVYEWTQHWRVARLLEISEADLLAVRDWESSDRFDDAAQAVLAATDDTLQHGAITDATWQRCRAVFDDATLVELVAAIGNWRLFASLLQSLAVPLEDGVDPWPPDGRAP
jgi:alkylhydroperoxidase family enzyme